MLWCPARGSSNTQGRWPTEVLPGAMPSCTSLPAHFFWVVRHPAVETAMETTPTQMLGRPVLLHQAWRSHRHQARRHHPHQAWPLHLAWLLHQGATSSGSGSSSGAASSSSSGGTPLTAPTWVAENPLPTGEDLVSVWGSGPADVLAVGEYSIIHWNGSTWTAVPGVTSDLRAVWGSGPNDVWAAGNEDILHFNGVEWSLHTVTTWLSSWHVGEWPQ